MNCVSSRSIPYGVTCKINNRYCTERVMMFHFNLLCAGDNNKEYYYYYYYYCYYYHYLFFILIFLFFFSDFLIKNTIDLENSLFVCLFLKKSNWNEMFLIRIYFLIKWIFSNPYQTHCPQIRTFALQWSLHGLYATGRAQRYYVSPSQINMGDRPKRMSCLPRRFVENSVSFAKKRWRKWSGNSKLTGICMLVRLLKCIRRENS